MAASIRAAVSLLTDRTLDADRGVRREQRVPLVMDDSPAFWAAFLGTVRVGAVPRGSGRG